METINVFYQGESIDKIAHITVQSDCTFSTLKMAIIEKHGIEKNTIIFLEDDDEPADEKALIRDHAGRAGLKTHLHRCKKVEITVTFNGKTVHHKFGPAATIAKVKKWAAEKKFHMTPQDAGEHMLQISGTVIRPDPGVHIGTLTKCPDCKITFDLVPNERVNGFFGLYEGRA